MSTNVTNQVAYIRSSREFPEDLKPLSVEVSKAYLDVATAVNNRIIAIFPTNRPAINGEAWYLVGNQKQQGLRQVYTFTSTTAINHGITVPNMAQFIRCFGSFTDGTNAYGLFFASSTAIAAQITFYLTPTQIIFNVGAVAPTLTKGTIVLEWLSQP